MHDVKRKYVPDLVKQSVVSETNYARLMRLLPAQQESIEFRIEWHQHAYVVAIKRDEEFAYTSTWTLSYWPEQASPWFNPQSFVIRLYHDARMAEVVCLKRRSQLLGRYDYPNDAMHQPDEKYQLNQHLAEWLGHCATQGVRHDVKVVSGQ
ncbi:putative dehydrogenase [Marinobacterium sp. xm-d-420]|jgi:uncharacterized protein YqiB (DUF1249 family)|uniref:DUF1249 domain-containing protein n=1 Tax=Marinobacterium sp. xm-d-420 TaxID=2497737 RepID=UPI0015682185|nr:DUF1249 domain-containing protein [Marinobacterium sp. xm-d-420]NRP26463.1 putative dehydrogenase [Marinobacterium sp. xm-d-420]